jgi:AraC family transcriptional regulator of adaptative response/methylated-DNA-[protein]-cysteine methyltransferase
MKTGTPLTTDRQRWLAVVRRDPDADGRFCYAVRTTRIFCRPSCPARRPRRSHVEFFPSHLEAARAGYRPCRRCTPDALSSRARAQARVATACRLIATSDEPLDLRRLAAAVGLSRFHFHRLFTSTTGITPRAYAAAQRGSRVRTALTKGATVTEAVFDAGYGSSGRFYEAAEGLLGMRPAAFRAGGRGQSIRFAVGQCDLGALLVAATSRGVCAISLGDDAETLVRGLQKRFPEAALVGNDARFERWMAAVVGFVQTPRVGLDLPLDVRGTAFQERVWQALRAVPFGRTTTYTALARRLRMPRAIRAVAGACAANPVAIAIPCHRVVRVNGGLAGYRWGIERKRALLARESRA